MTDPLRRRSANLAVISVLAPYLVLALLPCILLWHALLPGYTLLPAELLGYFQPWKSTHSDAPAIAWNPLMWDGMAEFYPWRLYLGQSLRAGTLPLWNPHELCGTPFLANGQSAVLYPFSIIFAWLPTTSAFTVSALLHMVLTGSFCYAFLRHGCLRLHKLSALVGAAAWQLSAWQVAWIHLPTFLTTSSWIPLSLLFVDYTVAGRKSIHAVGLSLILGMMILAGHLQIALYGIGITVTYAICAPKLQSLPRSDQRRAWMLCGMGIVGGLVLALPQLLPSIELSHFSHRAGTHPSWHTYLGYTALALPAYHLATLFVPQLFGDPVSGNYWGATNYAENACYVGISGMLLGIVALSQSLRNRTVLFFAAVAAVALLMALGTILDAIPFFAIPGYSQSGSPARVLVIWTLCCSILAAVGTETLLLSPPDAAGSVARRSLVVLAGAAGTVFVAVAVWLTATRGLTVFAKIAEIVPNAWRVPAVLILAIVAILYSQKQKRMSPTSMTVAFGALLVADLLCTNMNVPQAATVRAVYAPTALTQWLQSHAADGRVIQVNTSWSIPASVPPSAILPPNAGTVYGWNEVQGYDSLLIGDYFKFVQSMNSPRSAAPQENGNMVFTNGILSAQADAAAARYAVLSHPLPDITGLSAVYNDGTNYIYERANPRPRFAIDSHSFVGGVEDSGDAIELRSSIGPGDHTVTVADQWFCGWRTTVNGVSAPILVSDGVFRVVHVNLKKADGGVIDLKMNYLPSAFQFGLFCMLCILAAFCGIAARELLTQRFRKGS